MRTAMTLAVGPVRTFRFKSRTQPDGRYITQVGPDGAVECNCLGWERHHNCWHVRTARRRIADMEREQEATQVAEPEEESRALVPIMVSPPATTLPTVHEIDVMALIAGRAARATGLVPKAIDTPDKAFAVMLAGWEVGMKPMTALRHVFVVNGRTELDAQAMMGVVMARDETARFVFHTPLDRRNLESDVELFRRGRSVAHFKYTLEDAQRSGQAKREGPWQLYRADMLAWNAIRRCCRFGAPDLINVMGAVDVGEAGEMMGDLPDQSALVIDVEALPADELVNEGDEAPLAPEVEAPAEPVEEPAPIEDFTYNDFLLAVKRLKLPSRAVAFTTLGIDSGTEEERKALVHAEAERLGIPAGRAWEILARCLADIVKAVKRGETWEAARAAVDPMGQLAREAEAERGEQEELPLA